MAETRRCFTLWPRNGNSDLAFGCSISIISVPNFFQDAQPLLQTAINQDIHGGEIETAYLQYALPQTVKADFIRPENDVFVELKNYYYGWLTRDLAPGSGLLGGASRSTLETGEKLFRYVQDKLAGYFHAFDKELNDARK